MPGGEGKQLNQPGNGQPGSQAAATGSNQELRSQGSERAQSSRGSSWSLRAARKQAKAIQEHLEALQSSWEVARGGEGSPRAFANSAQSDGAQPQIRWRTSMQDQI